MKNYVKGIVNIYNKVFIFFNIWSICMSIFTRFDTFLFRWLENFGYKFNGVITVN